jgi:hypothetical protein
MRHCILRGKGEKENVIRSTGSFYLQVGHKVIKFSIYNGPNNALVCNKTLIQMSHTNTLKITPKYFDHQLIIIRELFDPG